MASYILRRLLLMIPTLFGIMLVSFIIIQFAPGGPIEQLMAKVSGQDVSATERISGGGGDFGNQSQAGNESSYRGSQGLPEDFVEEFKKQYDLDKPAYIRFLKMMKNYLLFDFGKSFFKGKGVIELIKERLPVSISLGIWLFLITYLVSIPLGIAKAVREGNTFDLSTSSILVVFYSIPSFSLGLLLIIFLSGSNFLDILPSRGLTSEGWADFPWYQKITDYFQHITLPLIALGIGAFTVMTFLTKNSFLDEIKKQYVMTAKAKGLTEKKVLYGHVFRNAMLIVIAGFPGAFLAAFFSGTILIESLFNIEGLGLLSYEAVRERDYPIIFASLYIFGILGIITQLITDITYMLVDPRIDFESREV